MTPQLGQPTAEFGLENDNEGDGEKDGEAADDPADYDQVQELRDQGQGEEDDGEAGQDLGAAGSPKIEVPIIDPDAQQNDLEETPPAFDPDLKELLHHFAASKSASVTRRAATFSLTS